MHEVKPFPVKKTPVYLTVLFTVLTYGIYCPAWFLKRRDALNEITTLRNLSVKVFVICIILNSFQLILDVALVAQNLSITIAFIVWVLLVLQCFKIKKMLEEFISEHRPFAYTISGLATFLFGIFYLQYEINKIHALESQVDGEDQQSTSSTGSESSFRQGNIQRGRPMFIFDAIGNILSIFPKIIFLNWRMNNHRISGETEDYMKRFIERHGLEDVTVRLNQYAPIEELLSLEKNKSVSPLLRYPFGGLFMFSYTFTPMRLVGGDCYNPYANTVHIFSDHIGIALHELGHALDFKRRRFPGLYSLLRFIPVVTLYQEYKATKYALDFLREGEDKENEVAAYRILFPAYSSYVFGFFSDIVPTLSSFLMFPFIIAGHVVGRVKASHVKKEYESSAVGATGLVAEFD